MRKLTIDVTHCFWFHFPVENMTSLCENWETNGVVWTRQPSSLIFRWIWWYFWCFFPKREGHHQQKNGCLWLQPGRKNRPLANESRPRVAQPSLFSVTKLRVWFQSRKSTFSRKCWPTITAVNCTSKSEWEGKVIRNPLMRQNNDGNVRSLSRFGINDFSSEPNNCWFILTKSKSYL